MVDRDGFSLWWPVGGMYCGGPLCINKKIYFLLKYHKIVGASGLQPTQLSPKSSPAGR